MKKGQRGAAVAVIAIGLIVVAVGSILLPSIPHCENVTTNPTSSTIAGRPKSLLTS